MGVVGSYSCVGLLDFRCGGIGSMCLMFAILIVSGHVSLEVCLFQF